LIQYDPKQVCYFGKTTIKGLNKVDSSVIEKKIPWKVNDVFDASRLNELQRRLLDTELFSQVTITPGENLHDHIPIAIEVVETKFQSIGIGISYQTHFGAGGDLSFENKNVFGIGQKLSFETSVTQNSVLGKLDYLIPHFYKDNQTLDIKVEASREQLQPSFSDNLYETNLKFSKTISSYINYDFGLSARYYLVQHSVNNGHFSMLVPYFRWRYDTTYSQLDPKYGVKTSFSFFFYENLNLPKASFYTSFLKKRFTIAEQIYIGSFFDNPLKSIIVPIRFFGGTDEYLRGFKYYTVSPLIDNKPIGGKSCLFVNSELRISIKNPFGIVLFYDSGFVSLKSIPFNSSPYYQSVGFGFRYYAFFGPLRIDVGFPLDPRKNLDSKFKILASFGHTF
jgi:translocation and assembly module TamA